MSAVAAIRRPGRGPVRPPGPEAPDRVTLERLIALRTAGESLKLSALRVQAVGAGGHLSPFKGRGIEFDESRPYQPGDDLRLMDWRVMARTGKPHTKVFREERNRPVFVWLDLRAPMMFGTQGAFKAVRAAEAAALVAWGAIANGDRLGGLVFSDTAHEERRPRLGRRSALTLLKLIAENRFWAPATSDAPGGGAEHALQRLTRVARPGSLLFLVSDFRGLGPDAERYLRELSRHGDVFLLHVFDPLEAELPPPGRYRIVVGGRSVTIDTSDQALRRKYHADFEAHRARLTALARLPGVSVIDLATSDDPRSVLARRFGSRAT